NGREIAIIGLSGRFPGAADVREFWQNLLAGRESLKELGDAEILANGVDPALLRRPEYVKRANVLDAYDAFDAELFGYSAHEAELMDPQTRLLHEGVFAALEDAGYAPDRARGAIGLF